MPSVQLGPKHPYTLGTVQGLAAVYQNQGQYEEAKQLLKRAPYAHRVTNDTSFYAHRVPSLTSLVLIDYRFNCSSLYILKGPEQRIKFESGSQSI
jgi:hypothetical protein